MGLNIDLRATKQRTELFNLTQEVYQAQPSSSSAKSAFFHNFASSRLFTLWANGKKIDLTKQRTVLFNLRSLPFFSLIQHFFTILLHSRWTNVHFMGKWRQGLKIDSRATKQRTVLFNLTQEVYQGQPSSLRKNSLSQHFFTILLHSRWTNVHFTGKWRHGA